VFARGSATARNAFLDRAALTLRGKRPPISPSFDHTVWEEKSGGLSFAQIWFRTQGCQHSRRGGCSVCDYWAGDRVSADQMVASVRSALGELSREPTFLLLNACGSVLDPDEVPFAALEGILGLLASRRFPVILETRAETVTPQALDLCADLLGPGRLQIEIGLESSTPWILRNCVNKNLDLAVVRRSRRTAADRGVPMTANILLGVPFLSSREMVLDGLGSLRWALDEGFDRVVLFPAHIKEWTVSHLLFRMGLYRCPSLWALVDALAALEPSALQQTEIAWTHARSDLPPGYSMPLSPTTCPKCAPRVHALLDEYRFSDSRARLVDHMVHTICECRNRWAESVGEIHDGTLLERVGAGYEAIARGVFGGRWWDVNGPRILEDLRGDPQPESMDETQSREDSCPSLPHAARPLPKMHTETLPTSSELSHTTPLTDGSSDREPDDGWSSSSRV
jgi:radical SAM enzyme (TIGR01210 family)